MIDSPGRARSRPNRVEYPRLTWRGGVDDGERLIGGEFRSWELVHEFLSAD
jgi:hypothetical protein